MSDFYTEQLVKRKNPSSTMMLKVLLILATVFSVLLIFVVPFAIIAPIVLVCVDVFAFQSMDVEYEYLFVNGNLDVDKIMSKSRRKNVFAMDMNELEVLAPKGAPELRQYQGLKATNLSSLTENAKLYEMIVVQKGTKKKVIFEPNPTILEGMKLLAPRKVFL